MTHLIVLLVGATVGVGAGVVVMVALVASGTASELEQEFVDAVGFDAASPSRSPGPGRQSLLPSGARFRIPGARYSTPNATAPGASSWQPEHEGRGGGSPSERNCW